MQSIDDLLYNQFTPGTGGQPPNGGIYNPGPKACSDGSGKCSPPPNVIISPTNNLPSKGTLKIRDVC